MCTSRESYTKYEPPGQDPLRSAGRALLSGPGGRPPLQPGLGMGDETRRKEDLPLPTGEFGNEHHRAAVEPGVDPGRAALDRRAHALEAPFTAEPHPLVVVVIGEDERQ